MGKYKNSDIKGNPERARAKARLSRGVKKRKTVLKEELGLKSTKDLAGLVKSMGDALYKDAKRGWTKRYLIWKELIKVAIPKVTVSVEKTFEEFLKEEEEKLKSNQMKSESGVLKAGE